MNLKFTERMIVTIVPAVAVWVILCVTLTANEALINPGTGHFQHGRQIVIASNHLTSNYI